MRLNDCYAQNYGYFSSNPNFSFKNRDKHLRDELQQSSDMIYYMKSSDN